MHSQNNETVRSSKATNYYFYFFNNKKKKTVSSIHIVWYSENMEEKTAQFYSETQTEQNYSIYAITIGKMIFKCLVLLSKFKTCNAMQYNDANTLCALILNIKN